MRKICRALTRRRFASGQSMAEMAVSIPILLLLLLAGMDCGPMFYMIIAVNNAARAGAQYGSQTFITAADEDGSRIPNLTVTANQCTCETSTLVPACPSDYCTDDPSATFVEVDVQAPFHTLVNYPGIPSSKTLAAKASMQVEQ
jgi:Flp pilus assembly protein TadG